MAENQETYNFVEEGEYGGGDGIGFDKVILNLLQRINTRRIAQDFRGYIDGVDALLINMSGIMEFGENKLLYQEIVRLEIKRKKELSNVKLKSDEFDIVELKYTRELHKILIRMIQKSTDILDFEE